VSADPAQEGTMPQEKIMLIVELNLAGYRFSGQMSDLRRKPLRSMRFNPRALQWKIPQLRDSRVA
jgi:hypothetical protein